MLVSPSPRCIQRAFEVEVQPAADAYGGEGLHLYWHYVLQIVSWYKCYEGGSRGSFCGGHLINAETKGHNLHMHVSTSWITEARCRLSTVAEKIALINERFGQQLLLAPCCGAIMAEKEKNATPYLPRLCIPFFSCSWLASFFEILWFLRITSNSAEHTSELNHSRARIICSGIRWNLKSGQNSRGKDPWTRLCIPFFFRFLTGLIFWNPQISAYYFRFRGKHIGIKSFQQGKINLFQNHLFQNPPEYGIPAGILEGRTHDMVFCATCNKHSLIRHEQNRCQL